MIEYIAIIVLSAVTHELAHITIGVYHGIKTEKLKFGLFGLAVNVRGLITAPFGKKMAVYLAGPAASLCLALVGWLLNHETLFVINLAWFLFNILPAKTLDGGRILHAVAARKIGFLRASRMSRRTGAWMCGIIIGFGVVQVALFPPNFSLLALGVILYFQGKKQSVAESLIFTSTILNTTDKYRDGRKLGIQTHIFQKGASAAAMFDCLDMDGYAIILIHDGCRITDMITERELIFNLTSEHPTRAETQSP